MANLVWEEKYSVGIKEVDQQHKRLIQMISDLQEALVAERGQQALSDIVGRMLAYAAHHFSAEELLMEQHGYALYAEHKREHETFTTKAQELRQRVDGRGFVLSLEVLRFLRDWLMNHILVNDKKYAPLLISKGLR